MTQRQAVILPLALAALSYAFVSTSIRGPENRAFAAALLMLVAAAACGPFVFDAAPGAPRHLPVRQGALAAIAFTIGGAALTTVLGRGPWAGALAGPYAFALGAVAYAIGGGIGRAVVAAAGLALLATLFHWDTLFLLRAEDRKGSAALAYALNPAAAASTTLAFDWIHCEVLYRNNQTCESLVGVPLPGVGAMTWKLLLIGGGAGALGLLRRP